MRSATPQQVKAAAKTLLNPLVEDLKAQNASLQDNLIAARRDAEEAAYLLKQASARNKKLTEDLNKERESLRRYIAQEARQTERLFKGFQEASQAVSQEAKVSAGGSVEAAHKAAQARSEAQEAKRVAEDARAQTVVRHLDLQNLVTQVREARETAERGIREEGKRQHELLVELVKDQENRLQSYAERVNEQANALVDLARKTLKRATDLVEQHNGG